MTKEKEKTMTDMDKTHTKSKIKVMGKQKKAINSKDNKASKGKKEDGAASNSLYVESDKQAVDNGLKCNNNNNNGHQSYACSCQENTVKRQYSFVAKNKKFNKIQKIFIGKKKDGKNAALNIECFPHSFLHP